jgi:hypothetical protein
MAGCMVLFFLVCGVATAEMRVWHCRDGQAVAGEFERMQMGKVFLRGEDKRIVSLTMTNLVAADLRYVYAKVPPEIEIRFSKKEKKVPVPPDARQDDVVGVTATVDVKKTSRLPFEGVLQGELYLIGKEVATEDYRLFDKKEFSVSFPNPEKNLFEIQRYAELFTYDEYDTRRRGALYAGYVVAIYGLDGNLMDFSTNLSWVKEEQIGLLREMVLPAFFYKDCKERPVPRPDSRTRDYLDG